MDFVNVLCKIKIYAISQKQFFGLRWSVNFKPVCVSSLWLIYVIKIKYVLTNINISTK